jgi:hypothetical protein
MPLYKCLQKLLNELLQIAKEMGLEEKKIVWFFGCPGYADRSGA